VGLIGGFRRRTPGLRREEVADLAGLGIAWYTWLEQGRKINVSDDVLMAIARALRLNTDETAYLFLLASPMRPLTASGEEVSPSQQAVLDALDPNPAHIRDDLWNLLAWNRSFALATGFDQIPQEDRNLLWLIFTHASTTELIADWKTTAAFAVAQFRFECSSNLEDPGVIELVERLREVSPEFEEWWDRCEVDCGVGSFTEWAHPAGSMSFQRIVFPVESTSDPGLHGGARNRLNVLVPVPGTATDRHLRAMLSGVA
jgi:transcriptional regulator with XRE-family HTH domain